MSLFTDKNGYIRNWVSCSGYIIAALGGAILIIGGCLLASKIMGRLTPVEQKPIEYEKIIVTSKEQRATGMSCFEFITLDCWQNYEYFINGIEASESVYKAVNEGKTYNCKKSRYRDEYSECEEANE